MFLNTLAIGEWMLHNWTQHDSNNENREDGTNENKRPRKQSKHFVKEEQVKMFFENLPKLEIHYCRSQTSKLYLEPIWESKHNCYQNTTMFLLMKKAMSPYQLQLCPTYFK